jgi:hypothetical protein
MIIDRNWIAVALQFFAWNYRQKNTKLEKQYILWISMPLTHEYTIEFMYFFCLLLKQICCVYIFLVTNKNDFCLMSGCQFWPSLVGLSTCCSIFWWVVHCVAKRIPKSNCLLSAAHLMWRKFQVLKRSRSKRRIFHFMNAHSCVNIYVQIPRQIHCGNHEREYKENSQVASY